MDLLDRLNLKDISDKPLADFKGVELAALLVQRFPDDPQRFLSALHVNGYIGNVLYNKAKLILRGKGYDKTKAVFNAVSIKDCPRGSCYKTRTGY